MQTGEWGTFNCLNSLWVELRSPETKKQEVSLERRHGSGDPGQRGGH